MVKRFTFESRLNFLRSVKKGRESGHWVFCSAFFHNAKEIEILGLTPKSQFLSVKHLNKQWVVLIEELSSYIQNEVNMPHVRWKRKSIKAKHKCFKSWLKIPRTSLELFLFNLLLIIVLFFLEGVFLDGLIRWRTRMLQYSTPTDPKEIINRQKTFC